MNAERFDTTTKRFDTTTKGVEMWLHSLSILCKTKFKASLGDTPGKVESFLKAYRNVLVGDYVLSAHSLL